ncbi:hypothetical protein CSPAE12_00362 [Colletotrichum incanum]|nr:hypothetical protein CSPAE12_00362 [Colletotrichum incanum]
MGINSRDFLIGEWILFALCFVIIFARLTVRTWKRVWSFWLSEIFLLASLLFFLILVVGDTYTLSIGKSAFVEEYYDEGFAKWKFASSVVFDLGFYFPRFSLLAFYNEIFSESEKRLRLCLYLVTAYAACAFITTVFMDMFWCGTHISKNWFVILISFLNIFTQPSDADTPCTLVNSPEPMYVAWSIGIISELFVFALPFPILKLKALQAKDRKALLCIFLLGIATVFTSIVRFILTVRSIWDYSTCKYDFFSWLLF